MRRWLALGGVTVVWLVGTSCRRYEVFIYEVELSDGDDAVEGADVWAVGAGLQQRTDEDGYAELDPGTWGPARVVVHDPTYGYWVAPLLGEPTDEYTTCGTYTDVHVYALDVSELHWPDARIRCAPGTAPDPADAFYVLGDDGSMHFVRGVLSDGLLRARTCPDVEGVLVDPWSEEGLIGWWVP